MDAYFQMSLHKQKISDTDTKKTHRKSARKYACVL